MLPQPPLLRPASPADLDACVTLWLSLIEQHHAYDSRFWQPRADAPAIMRDWFARAAEEGRCLLVAEMEGQVAGFIHGALTGGPPPMRPRRDGEITDLYVLPAYRGHGVGRALVEALEAWFRKQGVEKVLLTVALANAEGGAFWSALNFRPVMQRLFKPVD